jgi:hypothetical protein
LRKVVVRLPADTLSVPVAPMSAIIFPPIQTRDMRYRHSEKEF